MSGRKRSLDDEDEFAPDEKRFRSEDSGQEDLLESPSAGGRHSGRVRKKSAKVLEMEEFEGLEKKSHIKGAAVKGSKKQGKGKATIPGVMDFPVTPPAAAAHEASASALQHLLNSPIAPGSVGVFAQAVPPPVQPAPIPVTARAMLNMPSVATGGSPPHEPLKLKLNLSAMAASQNPLVSPPGQLPPPPPSKSEKKAKTKATKKTKTTTDISPQIANVEALIKSSQAKQEAETGIKLKLKLSPPSVETPKSPLREQLAQGLQSMSPPLPKVEDSVQQIKREPPPLPVAPSPVVAGAPELAAALAQPVVSSPPHGLDSSLDHLSDSALVIEEGGRKSKKEPKTKSKGRPPKTPKVKTKVQASTSESDGGLEGLESPDGAREPQYSNLQEMALKVQTSSEKKACKPTRGRPGRKPAEAPAKQKRKRGPTAYMMWCNSKRPEVVANHPGIVFAEISRLLGELWHGVPEKEKTIWKRKAKRAATKASMITTGKAAGKAAAAATKSSFRKTGASGKGDAPPPPPPVPAVRHGGPSAAARAASVAKPQQEQIVNITPQTKPVSCTPIDVAAHLKLLGESLTNIGTRLQEHRGHIAVQGTLSVLLDSMLCALGPLTCLTAHVPELDGCPARVHTRTLDNIAYYMPGIG